jgi:type II secretory pathway component PulF
MVFRVTARDAMGITRTQEREAESRSALMVRLRTEHVVVLSIEEVHTHDGLPPFWHPAWLKPMTGFDVEMGLRQLASMLRSGVTLVKSLATVAEQSLSPRGQRIWQDVRNMIEHGDTFAAALSNHPRHFSEIVVRLVEVGEKSGELERAVTRAADQMEAKRNLRMAVMNALLYPFIAVSMAIGVSAYLVIAVIPKLAEFLTAGGAQLPPITQMLLDFATWVQLNGLNILIGLVAAILVWIAIRLHSIGHEMEDAFLLRIPITGRILRLAGTALFSRSMQIMTESGITLLDALTTAARLMTNRRFRRRVAASHDGVLRGESFETSLRPAVEFTPMLRRMVAVGEVSGALPETFSELARFHEMLLALAIKRFGMLIEPVAICISGTIVGFVYIAFFMALFAMAGTN